MLPDVRTLRVPSYEPYGDGVFLVRPDGHIGWAGDTGGVGASGGSGSDRPARLVPWISRRRREPRRQTTRARP